jgi:NAD(P)-dependent dehydrogenase (short-subunit alcohol dehydrogenase family)
MSCVVVTGGTRGIGRAIAAHLAAAGHQVIAAARSPAPLPPGVRFVACDVADPAQVRALFAPLARVDALVTAAGQAGANRLSLDDPAWAPILASNLTGAWYCCTAALERMPDRTGRIVTIASVLGLRGVPDQTAYCAAKHGLVGLTRSLALAVAPRGITVNAVCPGWVDTEMAQGRFRELGIDAAEAARGVPLGRIATPEDVAGIVAFLLGAAAGHITGQALVLDGGGLAAA